MFYRRCDLSGLGTMVSIDQKSMSLGSLSPFTRCYFQSITDILHAARADSTGIKHTAHDPERLSVSVGDVSYLGMRPVRRHFSRLNIVAMSFNISQRSYTVYRSQQSRMQLLERLWRRWPRAILLLVASKLLLIITLCVI
jgi:hypothetical protein